MNQKQGGIPDVTLTRKPKWHIGAAIMIIISTWKHRILKVATQLRSLGCAS